MDAVSVLVFPNIVLTLKNQKKYASQLFRNKSVNIQYGDKSDRYYIDPVCGFSVLSRHITAPRYIPPWPSLATKHQGNGGSYVQVGC